MSFKVTSLTLCLHGAALHKNNNELQLRPEGQKGIMWEEKKKKKRTRKKKKKTYDDVKKNFLSFLQHMSVWKAERIVFEQSLFNVTMVPL